jgi:hypothetical protein
MPDQPIDLDAAYADNGYKRATFRTRNGKAHRGLIAIKDGWLCAACCCPGSRNGRLTSGAQIIADGWDAANCGHY